MPVFDDDRERANLDLYALPLTMGAWARPCGCNQGTGQGESCVEIADLPDGKGFALRDSKNPERGDLRFTREELIEFVVSQQHLIPAA